MLKPVDPDQLVSQKPADQDPHCFLHSLYTLANNCIYINWVQIEDVLIRDLYLVFWLSL